MSTDGFERAEFGLERQASHDRLVVGDDDTLTEDGKSADGRDRDQNDDQAVLGQALALVAMTRILGEERPTTDGAAVSTVDGYAHLREPHPPFLRSLC